MKARRGSGRLTGYIVLAPTARAHERAGDENRQATQATLRLGLSYWALCTYAKVLVGSVVECHADLHVT